MELRRLKPELKGLSDKCSILFNRKLLNIERTPQKKKVPNQLITVFDSRKGALATPGPGDQHIKELTGRNE